MRITKEEVRAILVEEARTQTTILAEIRHMVTEFMAPLPPLDDAKERALTAALNAEADRMFPDPKPYRCGILACPCSIPSGGFLHAGSTDQWARARVVVS